MCTTTSLELYWQCTGTARVMRKYCSVVHWYWRRSCVYGARSHTHILALQRATEALAHDGCKTSAVQLQQLQSSTNAVPIQCQDSPKSEPRPPNSERTFGRYSLPAYLNKKHGAGPLALSSGEGRNIPKSGAGGVWKLAPKWRSGLEVERTPVCHHRRHSRAAQCLSFPSRPTAPGHAPPTPSPGRPLLGEQSSGRPIASDPGRSRVTPRSSSPRGIPGSDLSGASQELSCASAPPW